MPVSTIINYVNHWQNHTSNPIREARRSRNLLVVNTHAESNVRLPLQWLPYCAAAALAAAPAAATDARLDQKLPSRVH